jgi:prepilin-type N-terminal cleavage/methylation domain-containing protein
MKRSGFTLLEVTIVVAIVAILSISAVPAFDTLRETRRAGAVKEVERSLLLARAKALSTGRPYGVEVNLSTHALRQVWIEKPGDAVTPAPAAGTDGSQWFSLPEHFPDSQITGFTQGDASTGSSAVVWFDDNGAPVMREEDGARVGSYSSDALITLTGGRAVRVRRLSGAVGVE